MTAAEVDAKVLDILEKAAPEKLTVEQIQRRWYAADVRSAEKKQLIEEAVDRLFDQGKIEREYIPAKNFCYWATQR